MRLLPSLFIVCTSGCICHSSLGQTATIRWLGTLGGRDGDSYAYAVSHDGQVVVGASRTSYFDQTQEAFRWRNGDTPEMVGLGSLSSQHSSSALGVNFDGSVIVGTAGFEAAPGVLLTRAFRWTATQGMEQVPPLTVGSQQNIAHGVSADGSVVVGWSTSPNGNEAFRWTVSEGSAGLGDLPGAWFQSTAFAVNTDGSVVVGEGRSASGLEAFRWTEATGMVPLGDLPGGDFESRALAVSGDGTVVVGESATALGMQAFRWTVESGMQLLWLGLSTSRATGVNYDGTVIVGTEEGIGAFVWTAESGRHYLVALLGWPRDMVLTEAEGVSHDGRIIIGWGDNNSEGSRAWVVEVDGLFQCIADLNGDDRTNAQDFAIFAAWYGFPVTTGTNGDLNGDGFVNAADFVILASDFGCGVP